MEKIADNEPGCQRLGEHLLSRSNLSLFRFKTRPKLPDYTIVSSFAAVHQTIFFARGWSSIPQFKNDDSWDIIMRPRVTSARLFGSVSTCCPKSQPSIRNSRDGQWICRAVGLETVRWFSGCHVSCLLQSGERRRWDNGGLDWGSFGIVLNLTIPDHKRHSRSKWFVKGVRV